MPPLKQPTPLEDRAMQVLVDFFCSFCKQCRNDLKKLRRGIPFLGDRKGSKGIPPKVAADFYNRVLYRINETNDIRIGAEILMDKSIVGLDCPWKILKSLPPKRIHRIRGISRLVLDDRLPYSLDNVQLEHLTVFKYSYNCTDSDLRLLSANSPRLEHVDVRLSQAVTDVGLRALAHCPNLQFLVLSGCANVSAIAVNNFLSMRRTIRHLFAWPDIYNSNEAGFDFREVPNWEVDLSVHESLESFTIVDDFSNLHLRHIITRFPNLKSLNIWENSRLDLSLIKSLSKLSRIDFDQGDGSSWANFESLLKLIGPQIQRLRVFSENFDTIPQYLDSTFRFCKNLEDLDICCDGRQGSCEVELQIVPPFEKLRILRLLKWPHRFRLKFDKMPELEYLFAWGFDVTLDEIESIMLDHKNFPNLKKINVMNRIETDWILGFADFDHLKNILKTNNLDLTIL